MTRQKGFASNALFHIKECQRRECRFRFPVAVEADAGDPCPRCGGSTSSVTKPFDGRGVMQAVAQAVGPPVAALLDNVRSSYNVGSMFRTCDGAGVLHIHLCGITATPEQPKVAKTALGADQNVPWSYHANSLDALGRLKESGYLVWSLENRQPAQSIFEIDPGKVGAPVLLIVGNELSGVDPGLLKASDQIVYLPMLGRKSSLNAVVAFGAVVYWLRFGLRMPAFTHDLG